MLSRITFFVSIAVWLLSWTGGPATATENTLSSTNKNITLKYHVTGGFDGISAEASGHAFTPMAGGGIVIDYNGKMIGPSDYRITTTDVRREGDWVSSTQRAEITGDSQVGNESVSYTLRVCLSDESARIQISSDSPHIRGIYPGQCSGIGTIRSLPVNRYGEQWGWGTTNAYWLDDAKLWVKGTWDLDHGNYSLVGCALSDFSKTSLFEGLTYLTRSDGSVASLRETLTMRLSRDLWKTVPKIDNPPSPFAADLRNMIYLDMWEAGFGSCEKMLRQVRACVGDSYKFYTTVHAWQSKGYDNCSPNVMPPNESMGGMEGMRSLLAAGRQIGYIGLHNNYTMTGAPDDVAARAGMKPLLDKQGKQIPKMGSFVPKSCTMLAGAKAIEPSIQAMGTSGVFLDELGAGGIAHTPNWSPTSISIPLIRTA